jgi:hypothetical protein
MIDVLLPTTDQGALVQAIVVLMLGGLAVFVLRRHREARIFAIGATVLLLALMGVRAIH